jgi:hypothetical protein
VSRAKYGDTASQGRFPLRPGKPLVHRRLNGAWGYTCICIGHTRGPHPAGSSRHNCDSWRHALREALDHIAYWHKTPAQYETEALETLYALPAAERSAS